MVDLELSNLSRRQALVSFLVAGLLVGAGLTFLGMNLDKVSKQQAGQEVVSTLEAQTGQDLELLNVEKRSGLYVVNVRGQNNQVSTFYVTQDGSTVATSVSSLDQTRRLANARSTLSSCMQQRNVVMFGNISQRETQAQIQLLGGQRYVSGIYADINNQQVLQQAAQIGIQRVPAFYYNGSVRQGVQTPQQLVQFTGCSYSFNSSSS
ncbi:MAG: hypothetical protein ABEJ07_03600 [Candidatus Nanohaloarchaea archaeon]